MATFSNLWMRIRTRSLSIDSLGVWILSSFFLFLKSLIFLWARDGEVMDFGLFKCVLELWLLLIEM